MFVFNDNSTQFYSYKLFNNSIFDVHINFLRTFVNVCERIWEFACSRERFISVHNFQYHSFMFNYIHFCSKTFICVQLYSYTFIFVQLYSNYLWAFMKVVFIFWSYYVENKMLTQMEPFFFLYVTYMYDMNLQKNYQMNWFRYVYVYVYSSINNFMNTTVNFSRLPTELKMGSRNWNFFNISMLLWH